MSQSKLQNSTKFSYNLIAKKLSPITMVITKTETINQVCNRYQIREI